MFLICSIFCLFCLSSSFFLGFLNQFEVFLKGRFASDSPCCVLLSVSIAFYENVLLICLIFCFDVVFLAGVLKESLNYIYLIAVIPKRRLANNDFCLNCYLLTTCLE